MKIRVFAIAAALAVSVPATPRSRGRSSRHGSFLDLVQCGAGQVRSRRRAPAQFRLP